MKLSLCPQRRHPDATVKPKGELTLWLILTTSSFVSKAKYIIPKNALYHFNSAVLVF